MQFTDRQIAETFDYARFEPSDGMKKIIDAFAEKYKLVQKGSREKMSFSELSGDNAAKITKRPEQGLSKDIQKKNDKSL